MNFLYDENLCIGCQACSVVCKTQNGVPSGFFRLQVRSHTSGVFPKLVMNFKRHSCVMCKNPPCVGVCPTKASFMDKNFITHVDEKKCISCRYCVVACPYQARFINPISGAVEKCDFCYEKRLKFNLLPACVEICPTDALIFNSDKDVQRVIFYEKAHLGTKPTLGVIANKKAIL